MKVLPNVSRSYSLTHCIVCNHDLVGRRDKKFCGLKCKNMYRTLRCQDNAQATSEIDRRLHRNRTILMELYDEARTQKFITPRNRLLRKGFAFQHFTSRSVNKNGKVYAHIYEFSWMEFSTSDIMIIRKVPKDKSTHKSGKLDSI